MLNSVTLTGRPTRDPVIAYTVKSGKPYAKFTLAVERRYISKKIGERETDFIYIGCWGKLAERCKEHVHKGTLIIVTGRLRTQSWHTPNGELRASAEVVADNVVILEPDVVAPTPAAEIEGA